MKILFLTSNASTLISFRYLLIKKLIENGHELFLLAPNYNDNIRSKIIEIGARPVDCKINRVGLNPLVDFCNCINLYLLIKKIKPDIFFGYMIKPVIFGSIAAKFAKVAKIITMVEGLGFVFTPSADNKSIKRFFLKILVSYLYKLGMLCANKVIFLNSDDLNQMVSEKIVSSDKCFVLGGIGVRLDFWVKEPPVLDSVVFIMVARLLKEKGVFDYLNAARIVKRKYSNTKFILLGGLDENPGSIKLEEIKFFLKNEIVEWKGHTQVQPWLAQSSVFVLPSYREGVPASTQEAMAMGRPVITTDVPGCRETVIDGDNGFLVPVQDPESLANAMIKFVEKPELIEKMGRRSRQIAEDKFDVHKVNKILIQHFGL